MNQEANSSNFDRHKKLQDFLAAMPSNLSWSWDGGFESSLSAFNESSRDTVRSSLEQFFELTWDPDNIDDAPDAVRLVNDQFGGLRSGQCLFTSDPANDCFLFCAWWPWGDGKTTSIRIGAAYSQPVGNDARAELLNDVRAAFDLD